MFARAARFVSRSAVFVMLLGGALSAGVYAWHDRIMQMPGPHQDDVFVVIEPGSGHKILRGILNRAGILHQLYHYDAARLLAGSSFLPKSGEFLLPAHTNLNEVLSIIHNGYSYQRRLTVVEGVRSADVVNMIIGMPNLTGKVKSIPNEGSLRPETYFYTHATPRQDLINRMQETQEMFLAEAWIDREKDLPYASPQDALIMASIIEKEASTAVDRRLVSAVLTNRLLRGMRLQSDPTVLYAVSENQTKHAPITKSDLKTKTAWNTYVISGLPKTPICNPGKESIIAALHPAKSDYLYFVSDGSGGLRFAKNLDAHNHNVSLFRRHKTALEKGKDK
ncbi:endolytic transglycosylase MltG [Candidatus Puniceispirillum sp.]|nr:endolytic transglycosylase MltG [Candidatus Puniceispirillum sp.]